MYFEIFITKEYKASSIFEKIDLLLTLHSIFNLMLDSTEKIRETRDLDLFEEEVLRLELLNIKEDVWKCENEINSICENTNNTYILEKVEAIEISQMLHEITEREQISDNLVQSLKRLILSIHLYCLQIKDLKRRASTSDINENERNILSKIIESLKLKIIKNYQEIDYQERWVIPINFRHRREIIDAVEDSEIEALKVLPLENSWITVSYLKDEKNGNIDLRKWKSKKWLVKRYDMFRSSKYPILDYGYIFNFQALINGFARYSFKKQIEVGLAYYISYKTQLDALIKWRKNRPEKLSEYEELIYNYKIIKYQTCLDT